MLFLKFQTFSPRAPPRELGLKPDSPFGPITPRSPFSPLSPWSPFCPFGPTGPKNNGHKTESREYPCEKILSEMINVRPPTIPNNDRDISPPPHTRCTALIYWKLLRQNTLTPHLHTLRSGNLFSGRSWTDLELAQNGPLSAWKYISMKCSPHLFMLNLPTLHCRHAQVSILTGVPAQSVQRVKTVVVQLGGIMIRVRVSEIHPSAVSRILFALFFEFLTIKSHKSLPFVRF